MTVTEASYYVDRKRRAEDMLKKLRIGHRNPCHKNHLASYCRPCAETCGGLLCGQEEEGRGHAEKTGEVLRGDGKGVPGAVWLEYCDDAVFYCHAAGDELCV